ncbi:odorant receptor Or2-like [Anoplophora glabripennis]|uniref:odorant receptor Or2-like n=2 Tax=Anoplophora glabripennis TaxID=217634 RepID=UPI0008736B2F|nr:odorant receptor Or2-like [Anoplophora glabripennis]
MIFPKNEHLKITMYISAVLGVWPFIFEDKPVLRKIYDVYSKCIFCYYLLYVLAAIIQLFIIVTDEVLDVDEIVANLCITLLNFVAILRVKAIKTERVKNIIQNVFKLEEKMMNSGNDEIIEIYNRHARQNQTCNKIFLVNLYLVDILYFIHPLYVEDTIKYYPNRNETVVIKALPLSTWYPFDQQKHYVLTYLWEEMDVFMATTFIGCSDIFAFSLIIFGVGQIKILKLILSNFQEFAMNIKDQLHCSQEEASYITLRECILKHQEIIEYINEYNLIMKNIMVLDFLLSSVELASGVLTLLVTEMTLPNTIYSSQLAFSLFLRVLVYYWYANEIMVHGSEIGMALCNSNWYEESERVQKMMVIMLMRCNRELYLEIGPFAAMTLRTFLGVLKATYSYITVIY